MKTKKNTRKIERMVRNVIQDKDIEIIITFEQQDDMLFQELKRTNEVVQKRTVISRLTESN